VSRKAEHSWLLFRFFSLCWLPPRTPMSRGSEAEEEGEKTAEKKRKIFPRIDNCMSFFASLIVCD
jgi:hypothetical protein